MDSRFNINQNRLGSNPEEPPIKGGAILSFLIIIILVILALYFLEIGPFKRNNTFEEIPIEKIILTPNSTNIAINGKTTIYVKTLPENTTDVVVWYSSDPEIASVSSGVVTGHKSGTVTISAKAHGKTFAECEITVSENKKQ